MLNISHTKQTLVGDEFVRGVSGGERKRVSIAEMVSFSRKAVKGRAPTSILRWRLVRAFSVGTIQLGVWMPAPLWIS